MLFQPEAAAGSESCAPRPSGPPPTLLQTKRTSSVESTFTCALTTTTSAFVLALYAQCSEDPYNEN